MIRLAALFLVGFIPACQADETVAGYGGSEKTWVLAELDGASFSASATMTFPEPGRVAGKAPCNNYSGEMSVPYPWFEVGPLMATRMACPDLDQEVAFFAALSEMTLAEVLGDILILRNDAGREMVFKSGD